MAKFPEASEITTKRDALSFLRSIGKDYDETEILVRYARRELALAKDIARRKAGKAASIYLPTVPDALAPKVRKALAPVVDIVESTREHEAPAPKPAPVKAVRKPAPTRKAHDKASATIKANEARIAEIERALAARKAPAAKGPTVRKAAPVKATDKGL